MHANPIDNSHLSYHAVAFSYTNTDAHPLYSGFQMEDDNVSYMVAANTTHSSFGEEQPPRTRVVSCVEVPIIATSTPESMRVVTFGMSASP